MTKNPLTFNEATDVSVALTVMCGKNIRYLLVATDDKVDGVISLEILLDISCQRYATWQNRFIDLEARIW
ncbi:hypothetical protein M1N66_02025 [Thermodesulfovibrionales bacterium]|nr:hypothetical protein [Thermodesulfovibrionales bacterium]